MYDAFEGLPPVRIVEGVTPERFREDIFAGHEPVLLKGLAAHWPAVARAREGSRAMVDYLVGFDLGRPFDTIFGAPDIAGRFFYNERMDGLNFTKRPERLSVALEQLLQLQAEEAPPSVYVQSAPVADFLPGFALDNRLDILAPNVGPRIWIGNRLTVQTHNDLKENVAVCVAGRRRFTIFPPDQLPNLYIGPFEFTLSGPPVSMVRPEAPDFERYPRFREALKHARVAELEPGDAVFIPYCWWHHVQSMTPFNVLVNYWWSEADADLGSPYDAMLHAMLALRDMPEHMRAVWAGMFDTYVFGRTGDPVAHLPEQARGALGAYTPSLRRKLRGMLATTLARMAGLIPGGRPPGA